MTLGLQVAPLFNECCALGGLSSSCKGYKPHTACFYSTLVIEILIVMTLQRRMSAKYVRFRSANDVVYTVPNHAGGVAGKKPAARSRLKKTLHEGALLPRREPHTGETGQPRSRSCHSESVAPTDRRTSVSPSALLSSNITRAPSPSRCIGLSVPEPT